jgi:hypothetical protein
MPAPTSNLVRPFPGCQDLYLSASKTSDKSITAAIPALAYCKSTQNSGHFS